MPLTISQSTVLKARVLYSDSNWSPLQENEYYVNTTATAANLAVTEINYNPYNITEEEFAAGFDNADMFEFIELKNIGDSIIDLSGVSFRDGITFSFDFAGYRTSESPVSRSGSDCPPSF